MWRCVHTSVTVVVTWKIGPLSVALQQGVARLHVELAVSCTCQIILNSMCPFQYSNMCYTLFLQYIIIPIKFLLYNVWLCTSCQPPSHSQGYFLFLHLLHGSNYIDWFHCSVSLPKINENYYYYVQYWPGIFLNSTNMTTTLVGGVGK